MVNLCFYLLFIFALSYFIITFPVCNHHDSTYWNGSIYSCPKIHFISFEKSARTFQIFCIWYIILYCLVNVILEIIQLLQDGWSYFRDIENYIQWILYVSSNLFALPFLLNQSWHYQWVAGSIGVFSAYLGLLLLFGRFDIYGIYVIMFLEVLKTLLHVLSLFSILIVGFVLTFCIIRPFTQVIPFHNIKI
jgi:transient receptor potential cation channel subfamily A protein 1